MLTAKQYFDLLVKTSSEGGFPAVTRSGSCCYRMENGRKCAVGIIIPNEIDTYAFEGSGISDLTDYARELLQIRSWIPDGILEGDLQKVQECHDNQVLHYDYFLPPWNHDKFVESLSELECFKEIAPCDH